MIHLLKNRLGIKYLWKLNFIFSLFLEANSLGRAALVCREWRWLASEKSLWVGKRKALLSRKSQYAPDRNPYKIILVGSGGVGKSALTVRFVSGRFVEKYDPTIEDWYRKEVLIDNTVAVLDIIDTAGPEEYSALRDSYIREGSGFIIVYSISSQTSFNAAIKLRNSILKIKELTDNFSYLAPIVLVGNKLDAEKERVISHSEGQAVANKFSNFSRNFFETSARADFGVNEIFYEIVRQIDTVENRKRVLQTKRNDKCAIM